MSDLPERVIWVNGLPRSGTSWLCQIVDSSEEVEFRMAPLFSFQFRNTMQISDTEERWKQYFADVYNSDDEWMAQMNRRKIGSFPTFEKKLTPPPFLAIKDVRHHNFIEHLLALNIDLKVLHIIRDPRAAIHSWLANPKEFPQDADPMLNWRSGSIRKINENEFWGFDDWIKLSRMYSDLQARYPEKVHIIRYEELVENPTDETKEFFKKLGLEFQEQTKSFLMSSTSGNSGDPFSVFKDKTVLDKWRTGLDPKIASEIELVLRGTDLEKYLYEQ